MGWDFDNAMAADSIKIREELGKCVEAIIEAARSTEHAPPTTHQEDAQDGGRAYRQHQLYLDDGLSQMASANRFDNGALKGFVAEFEYNGTNYRIELHNLTKVS